MSKPSLPELLWHYTCDDGHKLIGDVGILRPLSGLVWMSDLGDVDRDALGLTSRMLLCDRTKHRYRVLDTRHVVPYMSVRDHLMDRLVREGIESAHGALPRHWYVSTKPVPAVYDPSRVSA